MRERECELWGHAEHRVPLPATPLLVQTAERSLVFGIDKAVHRQSDLGLATARDRRPESLSDGNLRVAEDRTRAQAGTFSGLEASALQRKHVA